MDFSALRFFLESANIAKSKNNLPHWEQEGACYFLTFHLADSLPSHVLQQWQTERDAWLAVHPAPWPKEVELAYHQRFSAAREAWLDAGHGSCCLREAALSNEVSSSLRYYDGSQFLMHAYVVMPNHIHALCSLQSGVRLATVVAAWKRYTATRINAALNQQGALWQKDYFDRLIRDQDHFMNVVRYIQRNPVKGHAPRAPLYVAPWLHGLV